MRVEQLGEGKPTLAVVGAIHGDEPCGVHAIEALLDANPPVERPVKFVIANERALERNVRYTETDLNRSFPGDPDAEAYETRFAHKLVEELHGCTTLSMHSTQSYEQPFALVEKMDPLVEMVCPYLSIDAVVETGTGVFPNALVSHVDVIEIECGLQGSDQAAENAVELVYEFLAATGAIDEPIDPTGALPVFALNEPIPKETDEATVHAENFERVKEEETFATVGGNDIAADEPFYPVLMSETGYDRQLGYTADQIDLLQN